MTTQSAHVVALALLHEVRTPQLTKLLLTAAMRAALARGCNLIFAPGETEADRALNRELGFVDVGSMVCYAAHSENVNEVSAHDILVAACTCLAPITDRRDAQGRARRRSATNATIPSA